MLCVLMAARTWYERGRWRCSAIPRRKRLRVKISLYRQNHRILGEKRIMANIYYEHQGDPTLLKGKRVAIVGYGSQGHAHALNLRDSGVEVMVACYPGSPSAERAKAAGLTVRGVEDAAKLADLIMVLIPDQTQKKVYQQSIGPNLRPGQTLMFAHGFNIHFGQVVPPATVDVSMIAPKGPGHRVRELYVEGVGVPALLAVHQDASGRAKPNARAYAWALGARRAGAT